MMQGHSTSFKVSTDPDEHTSLQNVFRRFMLAKGVTETQLHLKVVEHVAGIKDLHVRDSSAAINNLKKDLASDSMSWRVFQKGLLILGCTKLEMAALVS